MSERTTFTCDNCDTSITSKLLPHNWDYVNISSARTGFGQTMHLCCSCLKLMGDTKGKSIIGRLIELAKRGNTHGR